MSNSDSRSVTLSLDWLEQASLESTGELKEKLSVLAGHIQKKLWHQFVVELFHLLPLLTRDSSQLIWLFNFHEHVVVRLSKKINVFHYARWGRELANLKPSSESAAQFLSNILEGTIKFDALLKGNTAAEEKVSDEKKDAAKDDKEKDKKSGAVTSSLPPDAQLAPATLLINLSTTYHFLLHSSGANSTALSRRDALDTVKERMSSFHADIFVNYSGIMDTLIYSAYYQLCSLYYQHVNDSSNYYTNSLLYITYTNMSELSDAQKLKLAHDISIAAILGKSIYNFGELLQNTIVQFLETSQQYNYIPQLLKCFNEGDLQTFKQIWPNAKSQNSTLAANESFLHEKIRIMSLIELVFRLPNGKAALSATEEKSNDASSKGRTLTFDQIAQFCEVPLQQVEWVLMKALALKVIKGSIDQVGAIIRITWVSPRVLNLTQIATVKQRLNAWSAEVEQTTLFVQNNAQHVI